MTTRPTQIAGILMISGAVLANTGFTLLGSRFNYPDVLNEPATDVLQRFHADAAPIGALFAVLAAASALLIPIAWLSRRLIAPGRNRGVMVAAGIAAGVVQVVGLLRWPLLVPHLADVVADPATSPAARTDAIDTFQTLHTVLGGVIGELLGYALTALWTLAMVRGLSSRMGRWFAPVGVASAGLIVVGMVEPLVEPAGLANLVGYIAWSIWMIGLGASLLRNRVADRAPASTSVPPAARLTAPVAHA